ncbi:hypothetical protein [Flavobacterium marginilacus]|uniref:hypothetical protein n=1 Tax=Flavobacterium marginilacus TaxID=3003256 RepID=UPI00248DA80B|nr:hypothetical protein [Flavobacterium marginilacus]
MNKLLKTCSMVALVMFCPLLLCAQKMTSIEFEELKPENCSKSPQKNPLKLKKGETHQIYIQFPTAAKAKEVLDRYSLERDGKPLPNKFDLSDKNLILDTGDPFSGVESNTKKISYKILYIKNKKKPKELECVYSFELSPDDESDLVEEGSKDGTEAKIDYVALIETLKYSLDLSGLFPTASSCCEEDTYPCLNSSVAEYIKIISDPLIVRYQGKINKINKTKVTSLSKDQLPEDVDNLKGLITTRQTEILKLKDEGTKIKNRLIYDAKANDIYWFDFEGITSVLSQKKRKYFEVKAGNNIAFEIINVNPSSYKLSIDQTSVSIWQDANEMLLKYLNFTNTGIPTADGAEQPEAKTAKRIDEVRAAVILIVARLMELQQKLSSSCDNLHFKLIESKTTAKLNIDNFLETEVHKPVGISFDKFMQSELEIKKSDSTLYKIAKDLYNLLPASPYHMEYLTRAKYDKDRIDFKYSILARENTPFMDKAKDETIQVYITGNFKVDVSTGLYYAWLKDDVYNLRDTTSIVTNGTVNDTLKYKKIIKDRTNSGEFGFSSYLHFYRKYMPSFSLGGHIGVGLSLNNQVRPRYFTGLSLLFGRESGRIAINLGIAAGNVDQISNVYRKDDNNGLPGSDYGLIPSTETTIKYVSKFSVRPAIGISYNIPFSLSKKTQPAPEVTPEKDKTTEVKSEETKPEETNASDAKK